MDHALRDPEQPADLSPLAWVQEELRRSLESVHKTLRRHVRDGDAANKPMASFGAEPSLPLQQAAAQLHQVSGVLSLVGLPAGALLLRSAETAVQHLAQHPLDVDTRTVEVIERANFALMAYVARLLAGNKASPLSLFPVYHDLQQLNLAERIHPADLWPLEWSWREIPAEDGVLPRSPDAVRGPFEAALLRQMRLPHPTHAANLSNLCAGLAAAITSPHCRTLWQLAAAVFEAQALHLLPVDAYVKRLGSRLLHELRVIGEGDASVSERLAHDLLFFCAQAKVAQGGCPRLLAVHATWRLNEELVGNYEDASLGRIDPAWVTQARRRVVSAKDSWSAAAEGDTQRLSSLDEQFAALGESLTRLFPAGEVLAQTLQRAVVVTLRSGRAPAPAMAMEVATSLLYVEAALEDAAFDQPEQAERVRHLARRVDAVARGQAPDALDGWMEDLYRRVSDRQTMGSVVHELRANLTEVERHCDEYFRDPTQRDKLIPVPGQLQAMRGVLSVLGLDQAAAACLRMRDEVDSLASTAIDFEHATAIGGFERLANNLGALGFLIDMLSVQPQLAKRMFVFDEASGRLDPIMGRREGAVELPDFAASGFSLDIDGPAELGPQDTQKLPVQDLARLELPDLELPDLGVAPAAAPVSAPVAPAPAPVAAAPAPVADLVDDPEMLEIFLEEADEVIDRARQALDALAEEPASAEQLTVVRRAFHTLKGSARMVGLNQFGEGAWACEQLYNARLGDPQPVADNALRAFSLEALDYLTRWRQQIAGQAEGQFSPDPLRRSADALRLDGQLLPLEGEQPMDLHLEPEPPVAPRSEAAAPQVEAIPEQPVPLEALDTAPLVPDFVLDMDVAAPTPEVALAEPAQVLDLHLEPPASDEDVEFTLPETLESPDLSPLAEFDELRAQRPGSAEHFLPTEVDAPPVPEVVEAAPAHDFPDTQPPGEFTLPVLPEEAETVEAALLDAAAAASEVEPTIEAELPVVETVEPEAVPERPSLQLVHSEAPASAAEAPVDLGAETADEAAESDDGIKVIGPLRISISLFNIFLNEADELSRRLAVGLAEWATELSGVVPSSTESQAHALAGAAATVGYEDLSLLARELEHTLERAQRTDRYLRSDAELFLRAADDIRQLLHQFAAGFLKPHDIELVATLHAWEPQPASEPGTTQTGDLDDGAERVSPASMDVAEAPEPEIEAPEALEPVDHLEPALDSVAAEPERVEVEPQALDALEALEASTVQAPFEAEAAPLPVEPEPEPVPEPVALPVAEAPVAEAAPLPRADDDEVEPGLPDDIELDLYEIFEEEGRELLQQLHAALRDWLQEPAETARADACMRALHTFKGGARLAGAMRLGEQAHALESAVEAVLGGATPGHDAVQALQAAGDELELSFERVGQSLRAPAQPAPAAVAAPVPAPAPAPAPAPVVAPVVPPVVAAPVGSPAKPAEFAEPARQIDWSRWSLNEPEIPPASESLALAQAQVRVRGTVLERMAMQAGEVSIRRARLESELAQMKGGLVDLDDNLERIRGQLRELELQAEAQMHAQQELAQSGGREFDPLEFDRYTRFQELTRLLTESVGDVATLQRTLSRSVQTGEDELAAQSRLTRELQDDLLRTRLVDFDSIGERLHRVVRQASRDSGKQVRLDITGGTTELDRSVLERMAGPFEHLLRNSVAHGIEAPDARAAAGKEAGGVLRVDVSQQGNEVLIKFGDDGAGLNLQRIRQRGIELNLISADVDHDERTLQRLIFAPGFSTASQVTELSGRGIGMDVVRAEVGTLGGSIETQSTPGQGTQFMLRLPLTTALTQIVLLRSGDQVIAVPAALMDSVQRVPTADVERAYESGEVPFGKDKLPFYWLGGLLGQQGRGTPHGKYTPLVLVRSAQQRIALHVDEVLGNQEVVVKNLGPQLSRVPGLAGISLLASGDVALIYNVVALADWYGQDARARLALAPQLADQPKVDEVVEAPLIMVVDDSLTVRRVTQRLLDRVGYRVLLAKDGLDAMEKLAAEELPAVVLSDIEMPRMDGFDLVRNMRADSRLAELPVIMITSRIAQKHRDYAAQLGVEHYLGKPYDEEQLLGLIARFAGTPTSH